MDIHDKIIRDMRGETNNDVSYSADSISFTPSYGCCNVDDYVDHLKYRNEIEVLSRLKGKQIDNLYNNEINNSVTESLKECYHDDSLFIKNDNPVVSDVLNSNYPISWDEYFMNIAILTSLRSSDLNTKVGSVIVSNDNKVLGTGYNGIPRNLDKQLFPTSNDKSLPYNETKYAFTVHAEMNALLNSTVFDLTNTKLYCTLFPCCDCVKMILQKGISEIIYLSDKYHDEASYIASRKLLDIANVPFRKYEGKLLISC